MRAIIAGDLVAGILSGDMPHEAGTIELSPSLAAVDPSRLRFDGANVYEPTGMSVFYIDATGVKHVVHTNQAWQTLTCDFDAPLRQLDNGGWVVKGADDLLSELKDRIKRQIDAHAEAARGHFITQGTGQAMIYQRKAEEAKALIAAGGTPNPADYPFLSASVGIEADNLAAVAALVLATEAAWVQVGTAIEAIRLGAKQAVDAATDTSAALAVVAGLNWPKP